MSAVTADIPSSDVEEKKVPLKVAFSSFLGNFIEWFDYATYTYFAITIGQVFFPESSVDSTLMAFAIFALSALLSGAPWAIKRAGSGLYPSPFSA